MLSSAELTTDPLHSISNCLSERSERISEQEFGFVHDSGSKDSGLRQTKPAFVACPQNRPSFPKTIRNTGQGFTPPDGLANYPRPPSPARVPKLRDNTPRSHRNCKGQRTSYQGAPELVTRMTMVNADLISRLTAVMMADGNRWREEDVMPRRNTLQPVVRFFIHVVETRFKSG